MARSIAHTHPVVHRLAEEIARRGISQRQAALEIGVGQRTLGYWLNTDVVPQRRFRPLIERWLEQEQTA